MPTPLPLRREATGAVTETASVWAVVHARTPADAEPIAALCHPVLRRAVRLAGSARTVAVAVGRPATVALATGVGAEQAVAQPADRGTALAVLAGLMHVRRQDPNAIVLVAPAGIAPDRPFAADLRASLHHAQAIARTGRVALVPAGGADGPIVVGTLESLLYLYDRAQPALLRLGFARLAREHGWAPDALAALHAEAPIAQFWPDVVAVAAQVAPGTAVGVPGAAHPRLPAGRARSPRYASSVVAGGAS